MKTSECAHEKICYTHTYIHLHTHTFTHTHLHTHLHTHTSQAVPVCGDEHSLSAPYNRGDCLKPQREEAIDCVLQTFSQRNLRGLQRGVAEGREREDA